MSAASKIILFHLTAGIKNLRIWSGLIAIFMTVLLFALMPVLLRPANDCPVKKKHFVRNSEILILQPAPSVEIEEPKPLQPLAKKLYILSSNTQAKSLKPRIHLAFELNQGLTTGPSTLKIPVPDHISSLDLGLPNVFKAGDLDHPLVSVKRIPPVYPVRAKQQRIQGYVTIQFIVNIHGAVEDVTVIESHPSGVFDQSVITCVSDWLFKPGAVKGEVVNTLAQTTVNFELEQN